MTDTIADLLTRIRNAQGARKDTVSIPYSRVKKEICDKLVSNKFIKSVKVVKGESFDTLEILLDTDRQYPLTLKRVSRPGQRIYTKSKDLRTVKSGLGIQILSTSQGILTNIEARAKNIGGEILCLIY